MIASSGLGDHMRSVRLGSTGLNISELGFGGIPIIRLDMNDAIQVLRRAYEKGITFFDTANAYRDSEEKIGRAFAGMRQKIVVATKTLQRNAVNANKQIENSLRVLKTDYIDLYQLHQIAQEKDWQTVTAPDGALAALVRAKKAGKIRYLGVTSHNISMAVKLVKTGFFSTIQLPFNFIEDAAQEELLPVARELGMGIIAMKPFAGGVIDDVEIAIKYLRQHPGVVPIPGCDSVSSVDQVASYYQHPNVVRDDDLALMEKYRRDLGKQFCRRCEYCQPCPNGVMITMAMGYNLMAPKMSPAVSAEFCKPAMESILQCTQCDACIERCPYELPIHDMLKANYQLYEEHIAMGN
jgi:predicted aldo/keto reductase-like oxidoreductase